MRPPTSSGSTRQVRTVLVVDDEEVIRRWLKRSLKDFGFAVVEANEPDAAMRLLLQMPVDAVILDIRLRGQRSGLEVLQFVRQDPTLNELPAIVLTGAALSEVEEHDIRQLGAYVYFKPEGVEVIVNQLRRRLRSDP